MNRLSETFYLRKCYLETDQVPTQSVIMKKMSPSLAKVYYKSMAPKVKVLAGLEPPLKGGGSDWYVPPEDLLNGRALLKPLKKEYLTKLGFNGIDYFGESILQHHFRNNEEEKRRALLESDINWKNHIKLICEKKYEELSKTAAHQNTEKIKEAFHEFSGLYTSSINKIENMLLDAAIKEIKRVRSEVYLKMSTHYKTLLKQQATMLNNRNAEKLQNKMAELKEKFICNVEKLRTNLGNKIQDLNVEKHTAIEKLRQLLECQNLACQIYVALKEKEERERLLKETDNEHNKIVKLLNEEITRNDIEIEVAKENEKKRQNFNMIWKKKVCQVVKKFQEFIVYSLNTVPEQADFFLNIEKLMLLQLSKTIDNPSVESLFETDKEEIPTSVPEPRPFYLFCEEGLDPQIDPEICRKLCDSSTSQLPVIVVNKRCIYATCNNLEKTSDKPEHFLNGQSTKSRDIVDDHDYIFDIPVKYTPSQQMLELKEQSSVMQILQKEMPNTKSVPIECSCVCKLHHCFCSNTHTPKSISEEELNDGRVSPSITPQFSSKKGLPKEKKIVHIREPKWESYFEFMEPKSCKCAKIAKKTLQEHLPAYMRKMSAFDYPDLPNYEACSLTTLKKLVNKAKYDHIPFVKQTKTESKMKDISTQYSDQEFEYLCTCFDDNQAHNILEKIMRNVALVAETDEAFNIDGSLTPTYLNQRIESFVNDRASSVRNLLTNSPVLEEIFKKENCSL